jgi:hypothetical protein
MVAYIKDQGSFAAVMTESNTKLVVLDFTATW